MEKGITRQEEEDEDQKSQHEDDPGEGQEEMLEGQVRGQHEVLHCGMWLYETQHVRKY